MENTNTIIIFLSCIFAILIFGKILILPIKKILKLIFNSILGGILITIINWIGIAFNFHIGLNIFTAIFVRIIRITRSNFINNFKNVLKYSNK